MADDDVTVSAPDGSGDLDAIRGHLERIEHHAGEAAADAPVTFHRAAYLTPGGEATFRALTRRGG